MSAVIVANTSSELSETELSLRRRYIEVLQDTLGAQVVYTLQDNVRFVVIIGGMSLTPAMLTKCSDIILKAQEKDIPIVSEHFVDECERCGKFVRPHPYLVKIHPNHVAMLLAERARKQQEESLQSRFIKVMYLRKGGDIFSFSIDHGNRVKFANTTKNSIISNQGFPDVVAASQAAAEIIESEVRKGAVRLFINSKFPTMNSVSSCPCSQPALFTLGEAMVRGCDSEVTSVVQCGCGASSSVTQLLVTCGINEGIPPPNSTNKHYVVNRIHEINVKSPNGSNNNGTGEGVKTTLHIELTFSQAYALLMNDVIPEGSLFMYELPSEPLLPHKCLVTCNVRLGNTRQSYSSPTHVTKSSFGIYDSVEFLSNTSVSLGYMLKTPHLQIQVVGLATSLLSSTLPFHSKPSSSLPEWVDIPGDQTSVPTELPVVSHKDPVLKQEVEGLVIRRTGLKAQWVDMAGELYVVQELYNNTNQPVTAKYTLPLAKNYALSSFEAHIGQRTITGSVKEKSEARKEFLEAVEAKQTAFLVELQDSETYPEQFSMYLGNVEPGEIVVVRLSLVIDVPLLDADDFSLRLPSFPGGVQECEVSLRMPYDVLDLNVRGNTVSGSTIQNVIAKRSARCATIFAKDVDVFSVTVKLESPWGPRLWLETHPTGLSHAALLVVFPDKVTTNANPTYVATFNPSHLTDPQVVKAVMTFVQMLPSTVRFNVLPLHDLQVQCAFFEHNGVLATDRNKSRALKFIQTCSQNAKEEETISSLSFANLFNATRNSTACTILFGNGAKSNISSTFTEKLSFFQSTSQISVWSTTPIPDSLRRFITRSGGVFNIARDIKGSHALIRSVRTAFDRSQRVSYRNVKFDWSLENNPSAREKVNDSVMQAPKYLDNVCVGEGAKLYALVPPTVNLAKLGAQFEGSPLEEVVCSCSAWQTRGDLIHKLAVRAMAEDSIDCNSYSSDVITELSVKHQVVTPFTALIAVDDIDKALHRTLDCTRPENLFKAVYGNVRTDVLSGTNQWEPLSAESIQEQVINPIRRIRSPSLQTNSLARDEIVTSQQESTLDGLFAPPPPAECAPPPSYPPCAPQFNSPAAPYPNMSSSFQSASLQSLQCDSAAYDECDQEQNENKKRRGKASKEKDTVATRKRSEKQSARKCNDVRDVMSYNIDQTLSRGECLDKLVCQSEKLSRESLQFYKQSKKSSSSSMAPIILIGFGGSVVVGLLWWDFWWTLIAFRNLIFAGGCLFVLAVVLDRYMFARRVFAFLLGIFGLCGAGWAGYHYPFYFGVVAAIGVSLFALCVFPKLLAAVKYLTVISIVGGVGYSIYYVLANHPWMVLKGICGTAALGATALVGERYLRRRPAMRRFLWNTTRAIGSFGTCAYATYSLWNYIWPVVQFTFKATAAAGAVIGTYKFIRRLIREIWYTSPPAIVTSEDIYDPTPEFMLPKTKTYQKTLRPCKQKLTPTMALSHVEASLGLPQGEVLRVLTNGGLDSMGPQLTPVILQCAVLGFVCHYDPANKEASNQLKKLERVHGNLAMTLEVGTSWADFASKWALI